MDSPLPLFGIPSLLTSRIIIVLNKYEGYWLPPKKFYHIWLVPLPSKLWGTFTPRLVLVWRATYPEHPPPPNKGELAHLCKTALGRHSEEIKYNSEKTWWCTTPPSTKLFHSNFAQKVSFKSFNKEALIWRALTSKGKVAWFWRQIQILSEHFLLYISRTSWSITLNI